MRNHLLAPILDSYRDEVPLIPRMMTEWAHGRTGIDIHPGARHPPDPDGGGGLAQMLPGSDRRFYG